MSTGPAESPGFASLLRATLVVLGVVLAATPVLAETIQPGEAPGHIGQTVTVEGTISEVYKARSGVTFIDMGGRYPNEVFTGVIFRDEASKFPNVEALDGKTVDIIGVVRLYKGRPEIILNDTTQLKAK